MASITIPDAVFERLTRRAAELGTTAEALAIQKLETVPTSASPADLPYEEWKKRFDEFTARIHAVVGPMPPGHFIDDSRESIYEGCGE